MQIKTLKDWFTIYKHIWVSKEKKNQAGAVLGLAQLKLELELCFVGLLKLVGGFSFVGLIEWIWFGTFGLVYFASHISRILLGGLYSVL